MKYKPNQNLYLFDRAIEIYPIGNSSNDIHSNTSISIDQFNLLNNALKALQEDINSLKASNELHFFQSHLDYFNLYIQHNKVPPALFFNKFPTPFLPNKEDFVDDYNKLISKFQSKILKLCKKHSQELVTNYESELSNLEEKISSFTPNANNIIKTIIESNDIDF